MRLYLKFHYKAFHFHQYSLHSSTNLSINLFLHLQFLYSKYPVISYDLSHSQSQLLGFQINPSLHIPLSINSHIHI